MSLHKLLLPVSALILLWQPCNAEVSLGADISLQLASGKRTSEDANGDRETQATWDHAGFRIGPSLIVRLSQGWELNPRVFFSYYNDDAFQPIQLGDDTWGFGPACGLFYHFIDNSAFSLSLGPDLMVPMYFNDDVSDVTLNLGLPVNVDLHVNERVYVRMAFRMVEFYYHGTWWDDQQQTHERTVGFNAESILTPWFGFFVSF